jgi:hypothetical protein
VIGRLVKKIRFGDSVELDFTDSDVKTATIHVERNGDGYSDGWVKLVIEADKDIQISPKVSG